jgi:hypothetical protein
MAADTSGPDLGLDKFRNHLGLHYSIPLRTVMRKEVNVQTFLTSALVEVTSELHAPDSPLRSPLDQRLIIN